MTDSSYSARLQLDSAAAEVHHSSFTACNTPRTHSLITDRVGICTLHECWGCQQWTDGHLVDGRTGTTGRPCIQSVCNSIN